MVLAELREQIVGDKPHSTGQGKQHNTEERLQGKNKKSVLSSRQGRVAPE